MTGTHRHETETHGSETKAETTKTVVPSSQKEPVVSDPIVEAAKDSVHEDKGIKVGSVDGRISHGMTGQTVGDH